MKIQPTKMAGIIKTCIPPKQTVSAKPFCPPERNASVDVRTVVTKNPFGGLSLAEIDKIHRAAERASQERLANMASLLDRVNKSRPII